METSQSSQSLLLKPAEIAARFRISKGTLASWARRGLLTPVRFNQRTWRYKATDIEALLRG